MAEKEQRKRSPNFPYASVRECVEYLSRLHAQVKTNKVPLVIAYGHMGMSPKSSSADRIRASMSSYKLILEEIVNKEKFVRISELAIRIFLDTREGHRLVALREAALNDPMMKKMWDGEWKRGLPNDDATIISVLQFEHGFQDEAAKRLTTILKDNYRYCELATHYESPDGVEQKIIDEESVPPIDNRGQNRGQTEDGIKPPSGLVQYPIPLDDGQLAYISLPSSLTESDADFIPDFVNLLLKKLRKTSKSG